MDPKDITKAIKDCIGILREVKHDDINKLHDILEAAVNQQYNFSDKQLELLQKIKPTDRSPMVEEVIKRELKVLLNIAEKLVEPSISKSPYGKTGEKMLKSIINGDYVAAKKALDDELKNRLDVAEKGFSGIGKRDKLLSVIYQNDAQYNFTPAAVAAIVKLDSVMISFENKQLEKAHGEYEAKMNPKRQAENAMVKKYIQQQELRGDKEFEKFMAKEQAKEAKLAKAAQAKAEKGSAKGILFSFCKKQEDTKKPKVSADSDSFSMDDTQSEEKKPTNKDGKKLK